MTREETIKILSSLRAAFPNGYRNMDKGDYLSTIEVWQDQFSDVNYEEVSRAVKSIIATSTSEWPPVIGAIKAEMAKLSVSDRPTEDEAWMTVRKAVRNGYYHSEREFKKLHPAVQAAVGGAWQLKEWSTFSDESMERVAYSFKKAYREVMDTEIRNEKLPESVKGVALGVADMLRLKP